MYLCIVKHLITAVAVEQRQNIRTAVLDKFSTKTFAQHISVAKGVSRPKGKTACVSNLFHGFLLI